MEHWLIMKGGQVHCAGNSEKTFPSKALLDTLRACGYSVFVDGRLYNHKKKNDEGRKQTNFERLKEMDEKQLADFICNITTDCEESNCPGKEHCEKGRRGLYRWMKKEVE